MRFTISTTIEADSTADAVRKFHAAMPQEVYAFKWDVEPGSKGRVLIEVSYGESLGGMGHVFQVEGLINGQRMILDTWAPHIDGPMSLHWLVNTIEIAARTKVDVLRDLYPSD